MTHSSHAENPSQNLTASPVFVPVADLQQRSQTTSPAAQPSTVADRELHPDEADTNSALASSAAEQRQVDGRIENCDTRNISQDSVQTDAVVRRVEEMLDATELAISLVEEDQSETADALGVCISVVMPVFNECQTIREIARRVLEVPLNIELVIVDDCSTDGTRAILEELAQEERISVHFHQFNHGKGAALRTGFLHASGDLVVIQDADLEYDPKEFLQLVVPILDGDADVVYGSRFLGDEIRDPSFTHRLGNRLLTGVSNLFTGQKLTDMETCYKVFRREVLMEIPIEQDRFGFEPEITAKLSRRGLKIVELPIDYQGRSYSEGKKIGVKDALNALYCIVRYAVAD